MEWSVRVELAGVGRDVDPDSLSNVLEKLDSHGAVAGLGSRTLGFRLSVAGVDPLSVQAQALELVKKAMRDADLSEWPVVAISASRMDELAQDLDRSNFTSLAGVAELAKLLGVSKQRASELARSRTFPKPVATLASGPVWAVAAVESFSSTWTRRPGPKAVKSSGRPLIASAAPVASTVKSPRATATRAKA